jgi:uncharacterized membrane protein (UPF0127 family)
MGSFLTPLLGASRESHLLENSRNGRVVATCLMTAFDSVTRRKGLLGRLFLPEKSALLIAPCNAIHTWFMRFAIDVAFVAPDGRVVQVRAALPSWRIAWALRAYAVIELPAGALADSSTLPGDLLVIRPITHTVGIRPLNWLSTRGRQ